MINQAGSRRLRLKFPINVPRFVSSSAVSTRLSSRTLTKHVVLPHDYDTVSRDQRPYVDCCMSYDLVDIGSTDHHFVDFGPRKSSLRDTVPIVQLAPNSDTETNSGRMTTWHDTSSQMSILFYQVPQTIANRSMIVAFVRSNMSVNGLHIPGWTGDAFWIASTTNYRLSVADGSSI